MIFAGPICALCIPTTSGRERYQATQAKRFRMCTYTTSCDRAFLSPLECADTKLPCICTFYSHLKSRSFSRYGSKKANSFRMCTYITRGGVGQGRSISSFKSQMCCSFSDRQDELSRAAFPLRISPAPPVNKSQPGASPRKSHRCKTLNLNSLLFILFRKKGRGVLLIAVTESALGIPSRLPALVPSRCLGTRDRFSTSRFSGSPLAIPKLRDHPPLSYYSLGA